MAVLTVVQVSLAGVNPAFAAAAGGGDQFSNDGSQKVHLKNTDAAARNVTFAAQAALGCPAGILHNVVINVPAGQERVVGPFDPARFNDANSRVNMTYDAVANLSVAILR